jgi:DivIVA domain-containing protein
VATFLTYFFGIIVVGGVLFLIASFVFGRGEQLAPMPRDASPLHLPEDRPVTGRDVRGLRIPVVFRGYRMTEVDWLLEELADSLEARDREIVALRTGGGARADRDGDEPSGPGREDDDA